MTSKKKLLEMVHKIADKNKVDPLCSQGDFVTLTIPELRRLVKLIKSEACTSESASGYGGMTLRDNFAAKAMQGFASNALPAGNFGHLSRLAYIFADCMLEARG